LYLSLKVFPLLLLTAAFQGSTDPVQKHYQAAREFQNAGKIDEAVAEYKIALSEAYRNLGTILLAEGEYGKAVKAIGQAVAHGKATEEVLIDLATSYFYTGQYDKAIDPLKKALETNPRSVAAHHLLGKVYFMLREFDKAAGELEIASKLGPADFDVSYTLALAYLKQQQPAPARQIFNRIIQNLGKRPEVHNLLGRAYREMNYFDEAIQEFKKTIALNPKYPRAHYNLGLSYLLKDNTLALKDAATEFRAELAINPEEFLALYNLGLVYVVDRQYEQATGLLEKAARLRPKNADVHLFLGNAYHGLGKFDKAVVCFRKCIDLNPELDKTSSFAAEVHFMLGKSLVAIGRPDEGEKELQAARELKAKALVTDRNKLGAYMRSEQYKSVQGDKDIIATGLNAPNPMMKEKLKDHKALQIRVVTQIHNQLGLLEAERQSFGAAAEHFRAAAEGDTPPQDINYNLGLACYKAELYKDAISPFESELKTNPTNIAAKHLLGMCYFMVEDYSKASEVLSQVVPAKPNNVSLYYTLSLSLIKQNKVKEAAEVIQRMLVASGDSPQIHVLLGQAYHAQNDDVKALGELQQAIAMDSRTPMAHYYSGLIYIKMGKFDNAATEFEAEVALNPKDYQAKYHLGFVLLSRGEVERGARLMMEVIAEKPDFSDARYELGKALLQQGDVKGAIENLEAAARLSPEKSHAHYQLSRAYVAAGRDADGQKQLEIYKELKSKERKPTNP
jgi:tetratricopeptide (TPR) repeat protein